MLEMVIHLCIPVTVIVDICAAKARLEESLINRDFIADVKSDIRIIEF